jgi:hypothetical protein
VTSFPQAKTAHFAWVRPFAFTVFACLALASLSRLLLSAWLFERVAATGGLAFVLLQGIRFDLVALGLLLAIGATDWNALDDPGAPQPTAAGIGRSFMSFEAPGPDAVSDAHAPFLIPFELASVLLLAALIGAAYLARRRRES